ncbi:hypothetical protein [Aurantiacibacter spongiae]|uniref:DUF4142 domain-containing protein n=1 Tax=Aurantiacibacter spongiae TaxID=2488860 RepID=A0A3N5CR68_9SPHN|nr:hypothetical protein [Aurantiacibacter spongiae]RPF70826.1 hypothetical protein EG799_03715 [Aurantiacibacter spongiae]
MMQARFLPPLLVVAALLSACAGPERPYPSLAIRDVEREGGAFDAPPAPAITPDPPRSATLDRLESLAADARAAHRAFLEIEPTARARVNAAGATGSESWAVAQVALGTLETRRSQALVAMADLDRLYVEAATSGTDLSRIAPVHAEIDALVAQENATVEALAARLDR